MTIDNAIGIDVSMHESTFVGLARPEEVVLRSRLVVHTAGALSQVAAEILAVVADRLKIKLPEFGPKFFWG